MSRNVVLIVVAVFLSNNCFAAEELFNNYKSSQSVIHSGENLFADEDTVGSMESTKGNLFTTRSVSSTKKKRIKQKKGNLPVHQIPRKELKKYTGSITIYPEKPSKEYLEGIRVGEQVMVKFDQKLIGYPGSKVPVRAKIILGKYKGGLLFGTSSMSETTKRLLLNFNTLTLKSGEEFKVDADLLSSDGTLGIVGEIHSNKTELFGLDLIFSAFKGYSEATKDRNTNSFGSEYTKNNLKNAEKGAVSEASQASIDRIRNEFLKVDEFVSTNEVEKALIIMKSKPYKM